MCEMLFSLTPCGHVARSDFKGFDVSDVWNRNNTVEENEKVRSVFIAVMFCVGKLPQRQRKEVR